MRLVALTLLAMTVTIFIVTFWLAHYAGMPGWSVWPLFQDSRPLTQIVDVLLVFSIVAVVIVGLLPSGESGAPVGAPALKAAIWLAPFLGLLAAVQSCLVIWVVVQHVQTSDFRIVAPSLSESLLPLGMGLLVATLAAVFALRRPPAPPAP